MMAETDLSKAFAQPSGNLLVDSVVYVDQVLWTSESPSDGLVVTYGFMTSPLSPVDTDMTIENFQPLNATQQAAVRLIYATSEPLTGLTFAETTDVQHADIVFGTADIEDPRTMAVTASEYSELPTDTGGTALDRQDYVYLDNVEYGETLANPLPGSLGYETILHEIGHTLGLDDTASTQLLPDTLDNTNVTVMSYHETDTYKSNFSALDIQALQYLYADSGTIRSFGVIPVDAWPGTTTSAATGSVLAAV
jgi:hypothetical protein